MVGAVPPLLLLFGAGVGDAVAPVEKVITVSFKDEQERILFPAPLIMSVSAPFPEQEKPTVPVPAARAAVNTIVANVPLPVFVWNAVEKYP